MNCIQILFISLELPLHYYILGQPVCHFVRNANYKSAVGFIVIVPHIFISLVVANYQLMLVQYFHSCYTHSGIYCVRSNTMCALIFQLLPTTL